MELNSDFSNAQIGQKVYSTSLGEGVIVDITTDKGYPIVIKFDNTEESSTRNGFYREDDIHPIFFTHPVVIKHAEDVFPREVEILELGSWYKTTAYYVDSEGSVIARSPVLVPGLRFFSPKEWREVSSRKSELENQIAALQKELDGL
jgi:hypothetical protein